MRAVAADAAQVMRHEGEPIIGEQGIGSGVVDRCPFELDEDESAHHDRRALLHGLHQGAHLGIGGVDGEGETGIGGGPADEIGQLAEASEQPRQAVDVEVGDPGPERFELAGSGLGLIEQVLDPGVSRLGEQRIEIPGDVVDSGRRGHRLTLTPEVKCARAAGSTSAHRRLQNASPRRPRHRRPAASTRARSAAEGVTTTVSAAGSVSGCARVGHFGWADRPP